jgi:hypothetical protein
MGPGALGAATWQVMGYGTEEAMNGPGGQTHPGGGVRMKAELGFDALNKTWLRLGMEESRDYGGACYGDSSGPNFVTIGGNLVLAGTTITGDTPCYATNVAYRMDTRAPGASSTSSSTCPDPHVLPPAAGGTRGLRRGSAPPG